MKNSLSDLNNHLFEALERLNDDELSDDQLNREIKRAEAVTNIAETIVKSANVQLSAMRYVEDYSYRSEKPALPDVLSIKSK